MTERVQPVLDAHVHFWEPGLLTYPWLSGHPALKRSFLPDEYAAASKGAAVERIVVVECNCLPAENVREADFIEHLTTTRTWIAAIVAFADLTGRATLPHVLDDLQSRPRVRGIRHNIQGEPPGFCLQPVFVEGVQQVGRRGLSFDLCATHDQLADVVELAWRCADTRLVLDHCGKPPIRQKLLDPWRAHIRALAACDNVVCKLSGLLTEAAPAWRHEDLAPYANHVLETFGIERVMYGSDWPVLTLAGDYAGWFAFTQHFTAGWSAAARQRFYYDNAAQFYCR